MPADVNRIFCEIFLISGAFGFGVALIAAGLIEYWRR